MYGQEYARIYIEHVESGKSRFREDYLYPFFQERLAGLDRNARVLDVGCGWGAALECLDEDVEYWGIDPSESFFKYIGDHFPNRNITLMVGGLPDYIPVGNECFDVVLCSMTLHREKDIETSIKTLFEKAKYKGKVLIVDLSDKAPETVKERNFIVRWQTNSNYVRGIFRFGSGLEIPDMDMYFHGEARIEEQIKKYGSFSKEPLRELSIGYDCEKQ